MMSKMSKREKHRERNKKTAWSRRGVILALAVAAAAGCVLGGISYAKYYAYKYRQGISVASGLYFNSNRLYKDRGDTTDIAGVNTEGMMVNVNDEKWAGGNLNFNIEIRNYDNNLLYNDENLNVKYEICFMLVDNPVGAVYSVKDIDGTVKQLSQKGQVVKFNSGYLTGGSLARDEYQLTLSLMDKDTYNGARVLVVAYPTAPDYLYAPADQQHRLVGLFQGVYSETEMQVESCGFLVQEDTDYDESSWHDKAEDLSGLIFNVKTMGDVAADENNAVKQEAVVKWNSDYLSISQYDEYFLEAEAGDIETKQENGHNWTYMKIKVLPYTSVNLTFYKTQDFLDDFDSMTQETFEGLAEAYTEERSGN